MNTKYYIVLETKYWDPMWIIENTEYQEPNLDLSLAKSISVQPIAKTWV